MRRSALKTILLVLASAPILGTTCLGGTGGTGFPRTANWNRATVNTGAALRPTVSLTADFDGDGKVDILVGYAGSGASNPAVIIFFQDTTTSFTAVTLAGSTDLAGIVGLAIGDLDADSHPDVVAACNARLVYLHSPAAPRTGAWTLSTLDQSNDAALGQWNDVAIGNIDNVNGQDIVACNAGTPGRVSWFRSPAANIVNGTGWTRVDIDMASRTNASSVALADFDADNRIDVISTAPGESTARVAWYKNPANPQSDLWTKFTIGNLAAASRMAVADLNVDGRSDVISINGPGRQVGWYVRPVDATQAWSGFLVAMYTSAQPVDVKAADLNADNQVDVVVATNTGGTLRWFIPTPGQTQTAQWLENNVRDVTETIQRIALGDIDADGRPDVVAPLQAASTAADTVAWFENPE